jgi:hypothetical protein
MNEKELAENNKILEIVSGSYLYGTNLETSDRDYVGIFIPSIEYILGFKKVEEVDFSIKDRNSEGKNTEKALDRKLYEFRKFITLALENNPNIIEILFVNKQNIIFSNLLGNELLSIKHLFPHKGLKQRFLGYAFSQKHKMVIKKDNYFDFINALDYFRNVDYGKTLLEIILDNKCPHFIKRRNDDRGNINFVQIGDLNLMPHSDVAKAKEILTERLNKVGNREELLTKYGYDTKFGMHLIRLMLEGLELLQTGEIKFPLKEASLLKDIRNGKWEINKIFDFSYELEKEVESITENSKLPSKPNYELIEQFTINKLKEIIK